MRALSRSGRRFSVILIGEDSLDAHVGHLAALTGGQIFVAPDSGAAPAILSALGAMRLPHRIQPPLEGAPVTASARMGGMEVQARWSGVPAEDTPSGEAPGEDRAGDMPGDASGNTSGNADTAEARIVGAVAAVLVLPRMAEDAAIACAEAHGIVCHLTSLVLVDDAGFGGRNAGRVHDAGAGRIRPIPCRAAIPAGRGAQGRRDAPCRARAAPSRRCLCSAAAAPRRAGAVRRSPFSAGAGG